MGRFTDPKDKKVGMERKREERGEERERVYTQREGEKMPK